MYEITIQYLTIENFFPSMTLEQLVLGNVE